MSVDHRMNTIIYYRIDYKVLLVLLVFMLNGFISLTVVYVLCSNYVVKKAHEQVEKTLEMKKME